jgi:hypothetical protein
VVYETTERWDISGMLFGDDVAALNTAIALLEASYSISGGSIYLLDNNAAETVHQLATSNTIGGVQIVQPPSFPEGRGAEFTTFRQYRISVEAMKPTGNPESAIISFNETLTFNGGGPRDVFHELRNGSPFKWRVSEQTVYTATQAGSAVGYGGYPFYPSPIWPDAEDQPSRQRSPGSPKTMGVGSTRRRVEFPISWSYRFHSAQALIGAPTMRPT